MKLFITLALLASISSPVTAAGTSVYTSLGSSGLGVGIATPINATSNMRMEANVFSLSKDFMESDITYDSKFKGKNLSVLLDWHVVSSMPDLRLTTGLVFNNTKILGSGRTLTPGSYRYTFNGNSYAGSANEGVDVEGKFKKVSPYIGVGFVDRSKRSGFSTFGDVGVYYANPKMRITLTPGLAAVVAAEDVSAETATIQKHADRLKFYPVVRGGVQYTF